MAHSKLPWHVEVDRDFKGRIISVGINSPSWHDSIFYCERSGCDDEFLEQFEKDADFIVEACNNYERLLAENKAYETNNKNQAIELDKAYEMIGNLQRIVDKY